LETVLNKLKGICGNCEEAKDLEKAIAAYKYEKETCGVSHENVSVPDYNYNIYCCFNRSNPADPHEMQRR
jgi:hypothetical protein